MHTDLTTLRQRLLSSTEEPLTELYSTFLVLNLLVVFHIVTDDKVRTHTVPHSTTNLLLSTASQDTEAMTVTKLHDDFSLLLRLEAHDIEVTSQIFVRVDFFRDVRQLLSCLRFRGADDDDVLRRPEADLGHRIVVCQRGRLGVVSRSDD